MRGDCDGDGDGDCDLLAIPPHQHHTRSRLINVADTISTAHDTPINTAHNTPYQRD